VQIEYEIWREPSHARADEAAADGMRAARVVSHAFGLREPTEVARSPTGTCVVVRLEMSALAYTSVFDLAWQIELETYDLKTTRLSH
jgi:hypothetical protein